MEILSQMHITTDNPH